jgi:S-adenosyl-L-methionine hydrolase (adenosine-forming)
VIVSLLTDYGDDDEFVGVCHGVIRQIAPEVPIVDLTHGIERHDVRRAALVLRNALPYLPVGVHVAVVDPQVGTERRAVALQCADGRLLVGPDNGVLSLAWEAAGGIEEAVDVSRSQHRLEPVSATFHGRDLFCPVAAHLAAGEAVADAGEPIDVGSLAVVELPGARAEDGCLVAAAVAVDRFGNVALNAGQRDLADVGAKLGDVVEIEVRDERFLARAVSTFADVDHGEAIVYEDAWRMLAIAINRGDAAATMRLSAGDEVRLAAR